MSETTCKYTRSLDYIFQDTQKSIPNTETGSVTQSFLS